MSRILINWTAGVVVGFIAVGGIVGMGVYYLRLERSASARAQPSEEARQV